MKNAICLVVLFFCLFARGESVIREGACRLENDIWYLSLDARIPLSADPVRALHSGIALPFDYIVTLRAPGGWFGGDKKTVHHRLQLYYDHITRTYLLKDPVTLRERNYATLDAALDALGTLRRVPLISTGLLNPDKRYRIEARLTLDAQRLPVSLRLTTLFSSAWAIDSAWWHCPTRP